MNYKEFINAERMAEKAVKAAKVFGGRKDWEELDQVLFLIAELRHAAMTLCQADDPEAVYQGKQKARALDRLKQLFTVGGG